MNKFIRSSIVVVNISSLDFSKELKDSELTQFIQSQLC